MDQNENFFRALDDMRLSEAEKEAGKTELRAFVKSVRNVSDERFTEHMDTSHTFAKDPSLGLSSSELAEGRAHLRSFIAGFEPAPTTGERLLNFFRTPVFAGLVLACGFGSAAYAAEASIPGDVMYSFKLHVNEPVLSAIHIGDEEKALWAVKLLNRRMNEARALAANPQTTQQQWQALDVSLQAAAEQSDTLVWQLDSDGNATLASQLQTSLASIAHTDIAIQTTGPDDAQTEVADRLAHFGETAVAASNGILPSSSESDVTMSAHTDTTEQTQIGLPKLPGIAPLSLTATGAVKAGLMIRAAQTASSSSSSSCKTGSGSHPCRSSSSSSSSAALIDMTSSQPSASEHEETQTSDSAVITLPAPPPPPPVELPKL